MLFSGTIFNRPYFNPKTLGKADTEYKADESGCRIKNIPYSDYISEKEIPQGALVCNISESNSGVENARLIQEQIDNASRNSSGGTVAIPKGKYKTTTIELKSNVTLFIQKGAELVCVECDENEPSQVKVKSGVLFSENATDITVTGGGIINGSGESYTLEPECEKPLYALEDLIYIQGLLKVAKD